MIYQTVPKDFVSDFEVVSCFIEVKGSILLLHRPLYKSEGGKWGVPAGKVEEGEHTNTALIREVAEETGIDLTHEAPKYLTKLYVEHPGHTFVYYMYHLMLSQTPKIVLNQGEHLDFMWCTPERALEHELVTDLDECITMYYSRP